MTTPDTELFTPARRVADAVLFEGYLLYPYRASAAKNQVRWQFGVLMPQGWTKGDEPSTHQAQCLLEPEDDAILHLRVRFLHVQAKSLEKLGRDPDDAEVYTPVSELVVDGVSKLTWDEAVETEFDTALPVHELLEHDRAVPFRIPAERLAEPVRDASGAVVGREVRVRQQLDGMLHLAAELLPGPYGVVRLHAKVQNASPETPETREDALRSALIAAHTVLAVTGGEFISLLEPPEWAKPIVASCENVGVWPVLVGEEGRRDVVLASPIILYDYPSIAPESPGELFDGLENDEILTLRTMVLTDEEKAEARATDPRAGEIIDRVDTMPQEVLDRLHGAIRYLRGVGPSPAEQAAPSLDPSSPDPSSLDPSSLDPSNLAPWWDPGADASVSPETDWVVVAGVPVSRGSRVVLRPRHGRADAQDMFLTGRVATVAAVLCNVDDEWHLAVTPDDDPLSAEMMIAHGRYLYFSPDEVEPLDEATQDVSS